jgi:hypothetical protein
MDIDRCALTRQGCSEGNKDAGNGADSYIR